MRRVPLTATVVLHTRDLFSINAPGPFVVRATHASPDAAPPDAAFAAYAARPMRTR